MIQEEQRAFPPHMFIRPLAEVEKEATKEAVASAMILCRGNVDLAAHRLQISRATMYRKLKLLMAVEADGVPNGQ